MDRPERFFYMELAENLGYVSVGKMLGEVTSEELTEWMAYFRVKDKVHKEREAAAKARERARKA